MTIQIINTGTTNKSGERKKLDIASMRDKDREPVRGIFEYTECPGGMLEFVFKKYRQDELEKYSLEDGKVYTLPLGVAKHLNQNGWYPVHKHTTDRDGNPSMMVGRKVRRFGFRSLEFTDDPDLLGAQADLITVQSVPKDIHARSRKKEFDLSMPTNNLPPSI